MSSRALPPSARLKLDLMFEGVRYTEALGSAATHSFPNFSPYRFFQGPDPCLQSQTCERISQLRVKSPTGGTDRQCEKQFWTLEWHRPPHFFGQVYNLMRRHRRHIGRFLRTPDFEDVFFFLKGAFRFFRANW